MAGSCEKRDSMSFTSSPPRETGEAPRPRAPRGSPGPGGGGRKRNNTQKKKKTPGARAAPSPPPCRGGGEGNSSAPRGPPRHYPARFMSLVVDVRADQRAVVPAV